jgi:hypothetical protein
MLSDGTSGLWTIKRFGGITVVQDPREAAFDAMPLSALEQVEIDYLLPVTEIGPVIEHYVQRNPQLSFNLRLSSSNVSAGRLMWQRQMTRSTKE